VDPELLGVNFLEHQRRNIMLERKNIIMKSLQWRQNLLLYAMKPLKKMKAVYPKITNEFLEDAVDFNLKAARAIEEVFRLH
jgi:hypothetical protein